MVRCIIDYEYIFNKKILIETEIMVKPMCGYYV